MKEDKKEKAPNISLMTERFNDVIKFYFLVRLSFLLLLDVPVDCVGDSNKSMHYNTSGTNW